MQPFEAFITLILVIVFVISIWRSIITLQQDFIGHRADPGQIEVPIEGINLEETGFPVEHTDPSPAQDLNWTFPHETGRPVEDDCPHPIQEVEGPGLDDQATGQQQGGEMRQHEGRNARLEQMLQEERSGRRNDLETWRREREELNNEKQVAVKKLQQKNNKLQRKIKRLQEAYQKLEKEVSKPKIDRAVQVNPSQSNLTSPSQDAQAKTSSQGKEKGKRRKDKCQGLEFAERNWPSLPGPSQDMLTQSHGQATSEKDIHVQSLPSPRQGTLTKTLGQVKEEQKSKMVGQKNNQSSTNLTGQDEVPPNMDISKDIGYAPEQEGNAGNDPGTSDADPQEVAEEPEAEPRKVENGIRPASESSVNMKEEPFESASSDSSTEMTD